MSDVKVTISQKGRQLAYPKNTDVKDVRLSLVDRIDAFALQFPGETALYAGVLAVLVICLANVFIK